jgi:GT2 family glycosyltransferase
MTAKVSISIINYKTAELTLACTRSVLEDMAGGAGRAPVDGRVVIVDNASEDGSVEEISTWIAAHPEAPVELVASPDNTGFSGGHNLGITACPSDFILVLNSDATLRPGCLAVLLATAEANPEVGLFAPRLEYDDGEVQISSFRFASPMSELIRAAGSGPVTKLLRNHAVPLGPDPDPDQIEWASFACMLLRRTMVDQIGLMDEGYFLYYEDAEYCHRARAAGWGIMHVPEARAVHYRGGSGPVKALAAAKKRMPPYFYASRARFLYQTGGWLGLVSANGLWSFGRLVAQARRLVGKPPHRAAEAEWRDIWTNVLSPLGPRRAPGE